MMKLTSGINFINIIRAKNSYVSLFLAAFSSYVLALEKNLYKKCARLTLMKLTEGVNFINIFRPRFLYKTSFRQLFSRRKAAKRRSYKKFIRLTLMKLMEGEQTLVDESEEEKGKVDLNFVEEEEEVNNEGQR